MTDVDSRLRELARAEDTPAPEGFDERLRARLETLPEKGRRPRGVKLALIAACVCIAVVGTAFAAGFGGFDFISEFFMRDGRNSYVWTPDITRHPISDFPEQIQALSGEDGFLMMDDFDGPDEMELFLGMELYSNSILDTADETLGNRIIFQWNDAGELEQLYVHTLYLYNRTGRPREELSVADLVQINVDTTLYTEAFQEAVEVEWGYSINQEAAELSRENYRTANGLPVVIVTSEGGAEDEGDVRYSRSYAAHFTYRGMRCLVSCCAGAERDWETALQTLKDVLEGFT